MKGSDYSLDLDFELIYVTIAFKMEDPKKHETPEESSVITGSDASIRFFLTDNFSMMASDISSSTSLQAYKDVLYCNL